MLLLSVSNLRIVFFIAVVYKFGHNLIVDYGHCMSGIMITILFSQQFFTFMFFLAYKMKIPTLSSNIISRLEYFSVPLAVK
ncbi:hypothetical protein WN943_024350 [Citrus x changshan-huyou]